MSLPPNESGTTNPIQSTRRRRKWDWMPAVLQRNRRSATAAALLLRRKEVRGVYGAAESSPS
uniref:Uncharacterized protein n=1 Tax=Arundo donax TaxID=35708 RepID=A0A0A8YS73_ARUDO